MSKTADRSSKRRILILPQFLACSILLCMFSNAVSMLWCALEYIDRIIVGEECRELFGYHPFQCLTEKTVV